MLGPGERDKIARNGISVFVVKPEPDHQVSWPEAFQVFGAGDGFRHHRGARGGANRLRALLQRFACDIGDSPGDFAFEALQAVVRHMDVHRARCRMLDAADELRREEAPGHVVQRLPAARIIDRSPTGHGPAIVDLPIQRAHAARHVAPPVLDSVLHRHALLNLREPERGFEIARQPEPAEHVVHDLGVADAAALVMLHHETGDIAVARLGEGSDRFRLGEGLKAEFAAKAMERCAVPFEGLVAVPYGPQVRVAPVRIGVVFAVAQRRMGAGGPIGPDGIEFLDDLRNQVVEQLFVVLPAHRALRPFLLHQALLQLVVAAP
ncbi:MAG: hypothetical protein BWZ10_03026 [candidate division BRC1 bacterium ADurb.BinA364]|nr:MAG: hypothetical protein BWZ10_03026 [candidate division BRC1 bacterium ADurb.BinA364]